MSRLIRLVLPLLLVCSRASPQDGAAVFQKHCASCHRLASGTRAPHRFALAQMSQEAIVAALETGTMNAQGAELSSTERAAVADFLTGSRRTESKPLTGFCSSAPGLLTEESGWNGWGVDLANTRFQPAGAAGLDRTQVPRLKLKWAFGFPGAASTFGQPTVGGGRVFVGSEDRTVYSLNARTGCIYWTFKALATVRTAVSLAQGNHVAYFGDVQANVYALDSATGALLWKTKVDDHPFARITGAPKLDAGKLYVPVSSLEEVAAENPKYECCTFRGSIVALEAETGKIVWKAYTIPKTPRPMARNALGLQMWGPSGAAVWASPTLDTEHRVLFVGTGDGYSDPPVATTDAVLAFQMDSGKMLWSRQLLPKDNWNLSCVNPVKANCPRDPGPDFDIGASPILRSLSNGKRLLLVGQKSGLVHALDPDRQGRIVWRTRLGRGGTLGGIQWGGAADDRNSYFPLSDFEDGNPDAGGGLFAIGIKTGKKVWFAAPPRPACREQAGCSAAQAAPATAIPGVVFSGSYDGHLRAYDSRTGRVIWDFDTLHEFETVDGVKARGGSLNATGPTVAGGMVYSNSGYGFVFGLPGNVLLAFSVDGK